ncbi:MAG: NAD(P)-dependent oxidoreductase [Comamonadaceae bacterium]|nr:NAD(P)-dependent oxidoreductase [Comamonadaceae bacterium]
MQTMHITLLGTGHMGLPMARRLCEAAPAHGWTVHVWNRTRAKAEPLAACGAQVHTHAADALAAADMALSLLESGPVVHQVLFGSTDGQPPAAHALRPGALVVDMASIQPEEARHHAALLAERGVAHMDAPVSGGTVGAEAGALAIMAGGHAADVDRARPVLGVLGRTTHVGPHGAGQLAKLANQMIVGITIGAVAEALLLCEKGGADPARVREAIGGGFAESRILQLHGERMVTRDFSPRARMTVQLKDMRNALATAARMGFDAPVTAALETLYAQGVAHGDGDLDHSGLFVELARRNGMG